MSCLMKCCGYEACQSAVLIILFAFLDLSVHSSQ